MEGSIKEINCKELEIWNSIVQSFDDYEVFYRNEYVIAFQKENKKNGEPMLLFYENGTDRAMNVVFRRDIGIDEKLVSKIPLGRYYDLTTPYGYGGFYGRVSDAKALDQAYTDYCVSKGYLCEFVRFDLFHNYQNHYGGEVETRSHNVIRSLTPSLDEIWMDFKPKVRKNVKHASKNGLEIIKENTGEHLQNFLDIYNSTMDRSNAEDEYYFSREFFETINQMKDNIMYFYVRYKGRIISAELVLYGAENGYSYLGGTLREYFDLRPNDFLKYEIVKWAKEKGLKNFVLGGGYGADDGIFQYKASFAPKGIVNFYIGRKIFDQETYQKLVDIRAEENPGCRESMYFPKYRD